MNNEDELLEQFQNALMQDIPDAKIERQFAGNKSHLNFSRGDELWSWILVADQELKWVQKMEQLRHPNILKIIELLPQPSVPSIWGVKCEFIPVKTLAALVKRKCIFDEPALIKIMRQVASVLKTMHSNNIVHRGLCLETIFVRNKVSKQVTDIDIVLDLLTDSKSEQSVVASVMGEIDEEFIAPEVQTKKQYSPASDMYSLGALILKILKVKPTPKFPESMREKLNTNPNVSEPLRKLLCDLVEDSVEKRPSASAVWGLLSVGQKVKAICSISSKAVPFYFCFEEGEELSVEKAYEDRVLCVKGENKGIVLSSAFW